ncbi:T9SS type A sorting domain-containing protein [candidate division KSB1 bacterium]|nr:T9SS type A sorting domain-containing protein [candidate division KSB1 bacterium]
MKNLNLIFLVGLFIMVCNAQAQDSEFGDAPDGALAYPSLSIVGNFPTCSSVPATSWVQHYGTAMWFGPSWDHEPDGNAGGCPAFTNQYDLDECFSDNDAGLLFPPSYTITGPAGSESVIPCSAQSGGLGVICNTAAWGLNIDISITNSWQDIGGYVNVLIDWDQNGVWGGSASCATAAAPEHVLVDFYIPPGFNGALSSLAPPAFLIGPNAGYVWARFTITGQPVNTSDWNGAGIFEDGESEDYLLLIDEEQVDWGDAPDPTYPTRIANNGASHFILPGFMLGTSIDAEPDGQPDGTATGDDVGDGNDDEDGVIFTTPLTAGSPATVQVTLTTSVGQGMLDAWFDFNNDGDWLDANEQIFASQVLNAGANNLNFNVPLNAVTGNCFARFRLSINGGLLPGGGAVDGEVEDYQTSILVPIELSSFEVKSVPEGVLLQWITQSETENMGFHIYRSNTKSSDYKKITDNMIAGVGNSLSKTQYEYTDTRVVEGELYYYKLADISYNGVTTMHGPKKIKFAEKQPHAYQLKQNFPNPFNPETRVEFSLGEEGMVSLNIYNIQGQLVRSLVNNSLHAGFHSIKWDGRNQNGKVVPAGIYLYTLKCNGFLDTKKMNLLK